MVTVSRCPDAAEFQRLLRGEAEPAEVERLAGHLEECRPCAAAFGDFQGEDALLDTIRQARQSRLTNDGGPAIFDLIERLCQLRPTDSIVVNPETIQSTESLLTFLAPPEDPGELGCLGPYRVLSILGMGGMGIVFRAADPQLDRLVALKVMKPALARHAGHRQRFLREARAAAALDHDHIVTIHQVGEDQGVPFLAMQMLRGQSLEDRLRQAEGASSMVPVSEVLRVGREIAEGLTAAHERGLSHRDIKPANIWLENGAGRVKILDFGLAGPAESLDSTHSVAGTPHYMSPEQARSGPVDGRSDLFSLGCILYRMSTGQTPFTGKDPLSVLRSVANDQPRSPRDWNPALPQALAELTLRLLAKDPARRPQSAREAVAAIAEIEAHRRSREIATVRRRRLVLVAASVLILALGTVTCLYAPTIYRFATGQGEVVVQTDASDGEVIVKQDGETIRIIDLKSKREFNLRAGKYQLDLSEGKDGLRLSTREFTLERRGKEIVKVWVQPVGEIHRFPGHSHHVWCVAFHPEGRLAVSGGWDNTIRLWDLDEQKEIGRFEGDTQRTTAVAFSRDGRRVLSGGGGTDPKDGMMRLWDVQTRKELRRFEGLQSVNCVAFVDDHRALFGGWSREAKDGNEVPTDCAIRLVDLDTGKEIRRFEGHAGCVRSLAVSPDGKRFLSGANSWDKTGRPHDTTMRLWDIATGMEAGRFEGHKRGIDCVAFSPNGRYALSGSHDRTVRLWRVEDRTEIRQFTGHKEWVASVAFSPDGRRALGGGGGLNVWLWDVETGESLKPLPGHTSWVASVAFSPDGRHALSGSQAPDKSMIYWQLPP